MRAAGVCLISILLISSVAMAQLPTGTILGQVKDASGAAVPGARITARNTDTNQSRTAVTADDGAYRMESLPVGNYAITEEAAGFKSEVQTGLTLTVGQEAVANFALQVGETSQTVEVTAEAPLISTTTSSLGGLVDEQRIADLPLNGRNYNDLTLLQPGVTAAVNVSSTAIGWSGTAYSSNGAPIRSNTYMLDGALLTDLLGTVGASAVGTTLGVDGIMEYRVITNSFNAEYGITMGSQMTIVSKSGTNAFHGDAFEFLRNSSLDARNFFDLAPSRLGRRLPEFRRNNFGGAVGGPIKKDKTFFFGVYEGLRTSLGTTNTTNTLAPGCHGNAGDKIWNGAGNTGAPAGSIGNCPQLGGASSAVTTISAVTAPIIALYPLPNIASATPQYGFVFTQPTTEDYGQIRIDQTISASDSAFGRYTVDQSSLTSTSPFPTSETVLESRNQFLTLAENHIFSTSLLNSGRFSFSRTPLVFQNPILDPRLTSPQLEFLTGVPMGSVSVGGLTGQGSNTSAPRAQKQNIFTYSDDVDYTRGRHSFKFGFTLNHYQDYILNQGFDKGVLGYASVSTLFLNQVSSYTEVLPGGVLDRTFHFDTMGFYVQDSWRIKPRLTLNLGLRYEPTTTVTEIHGIQATLRNYLTDSNTTVRPYFLNPSLKNLGPRAGFAWDVFGNGNTAVRGGFGVLYDLATYGSELMVGSGYDSPFATVFTTPASAGGAMTIPYTIPPGDPILPSYRGPVYQMNQPHMLQYNLAVEHQLPGAMALSVAYAGSRGINLMQLHELNPEIPNGIPVGGACVAQPGGSPIDLTSQFDGSATSCYTPSSPRRNSAFGGVAGSPAGGDSYYNALQVNLNKRVSKGLQFQTAYTWSKLIDDTQGAAGQDSASVVVEPLHERTSRGVADFDSTHNLHFNAIYHLPDFSTSGILSKFANGWWASGILSLQSGYPFSAFLTANRSLSGELNGFTTSNFDRADILQGRNNGNITHGTSAGCGTGNTRAAGGAAIAPGSQLGTPTLWYDPCAFTTQPQGFIGTEGRNILRGPGLSNLNFSLVKDTPLKFLGEAGSLEFRTEFFNIFNHPNFGLPNISAYAGTCPAPNAALACGPSTQNPSTSAGVITVTNTFSRQIQFGLKILF